MATNFVVTAFKSAVSTMDTASAARKLRTPERAGVVGAADKMVNKASMKLIKHPDDFALSGDSRRAKFFITLSQFIRGGASVGSLLGRGAMFPAQVVLGSGHPDKDDTNLRTRFMHNGIIGGAVKLDTAIVSGVAGLGGTLVGGAAGGFYASVASAAKGLVEQPPVKSIKDGAQAGGNGAAQATSIVLGTAQGIPLGVARGGVTVVKATVGFVGGILGLVVGAPVAAVKAVFDI